MTTRNTSSSRVYHISLETISDMSIDSTSSLILSGRGYLGAMSYELFGSGDPAQGQALSGNVRHLTTAHGYYSGASHGGLGALYGTDSTPNAIYGDRIAPRDWGASGGGVNASASDIRQGGNGGGYLKLIVGANLTLDGEIRVDGERSKRYAGAINAGYSTGGGAGGAMHIQVTNNLLGSGKLTARGGGRDVDSTFTSHRCGGGGGRIALEVQGTDESSVGTDVGGGLSLTTHCTTKMASAGTVYRPKVSQTSLPKQIAGLDLWYESQYAGSLFQDINCSSTEATTHGDSIQCWKDLSGNNFHAKAVSGYGVPSLDTSSLAENSASYTRSESDILCTDNTYNIGVDNTLIVVVKPKSLPPTGSGYNFVAYYNSSSAGNGSMTMGMDEPGGSFYRIYLVGRTSGSAVYSRNTYSTDHVIMSARVSSRFQDIAINGQTIQANRVYSYNNRSRITLPSFCIGTGIGVSWHPDAYIQEVIVYNRELSNDEMNLIGNYLKNKYTGLSWTDFSSVSP